MLRYLTLLAVLSALSLPLRAQNVGAPIEKGQEANDPSQTPGTEIGIPTKALWFAYRSGLARFEPERSGSLSQMIIPENYATTKAAQQTAATGNGHDGFHWSAALKQSLLLLGVQHGYAMTQEKTRRELRGPFFKDYFTSVSKLGGWADGGRFFTNYISHPMQGSITGFIQIQNDPHGIRQKFGKSSGYWTSRLKAMAWSAAYSIQFELGPISQSSIGNVGLHTSLDGKKRKMSYVDLVVTPTLGTAWVIGEDFLDRFVVRRLEVKISAPFLRNATRMLLNPMRGFANMLRFKTPWYRDR